MNPGTEHKPTSSNIPDPSSADALAAASACACCGYGLAGLSEAARCPECGLPLGLSLGPDKLALRSERVLRRLRCGTLLIIIATCLATLSIVAAMAVAQSLDPPFAFLLLVCSPALWLAGWLLMAVHDRNFAARDGRALPILNRTLVLAYIIPLAFLIGLGDRPFTSDYILEAIMLMASLCVVFLFIHWFVSLLYIRALAKRLPRPRLARSTWGLMAITPALLLISGFAIIDAPLFGRWDTLVLGAPLLALVAYMALFIWLRSALPRYSTGDPVLNASNPTPSHPLARHQPPRTDASPA